MNRRDEIFFIVGVLVGAIGMFGVMSVRPSTWSYAIWYQYNDQKAIAVKPDGKIEFGPAYTAETLDRLLQGLRDMRNNRFLVEREPAVCWSATYSDRRNGFEVPPDEQWRWNRAQR